MYNKKLTQNIIFTQLYTSIFTIFFTFRFGFLDSLSVNLTLCCYILFRTDQRKRCYQLLKGTLRKGLQFSVMDGQHTVLLTISGMSILPFCISTRSKRHTSTRIQRRKWKCTQTELKVLGSMLRITLGRCLEQK